MRVAQTASRVLRDARRTLTPAPSAAWDPRREPLQPTPASGSLALTIRLPEDAVLETSGSVGSTLLDALNAADLSDVWEGGACGGACQCSTCRVIVTRAPSPLPPRDEDETDMLDTAAAAAVRQPGAPDDAGDAFLADDSRLACQITLRASDSGLEVTLPDDVLNILEVPLWLRGSR